MTTGIALLAAIITMETMLTDGTKTVETVDVPKTDGTLFVALATGMKYHAGVSYVVSNGWYSVAFEFHEDTFDVYEDISVLYRVFDDPKADYNDMAHWYRDCQRRTSRRLRPT